MPDEVKKIFQQRLEETAKDREAAFDPSDMYLDDLKKNFGSVMSLDSRNSAANRSNKPIASQLAKGPSNNSKIRVHRHNNDDNDSDEEDDDDILGRSGGEEEDLRQSFGKKTGGLAQLKAKLSLQEELGALKSELSDFDSQIQKRETSIKSSDDETYNAVKNMEEVEERDDADDLDDDDEDDEMDDGGRLSAKDLVSSEAKQPASETTTTTESNDSGSNGSSISENDKSDTSASDTTPPTPESSVTNEESKAKEGEND